MLSYGRGEELVGREGVALASQAEEGTYGWGNEKLRYKTAGLSPAE